MASNEDDIKTIKLIHSSKKHLFANLVDNYKGAVMSVIYRFTGDRNESEDVAQETFVKAFKYLGSFDTNKTFSTWLLKIATNCSYDHISKMRKRAFESIDQKNEDQKEFEVKSDETTPEEKMIAFDENIQLQSALMKLPDQYREILVLRYVQELSYNEIADVMEIPMSSVKVNIHRAKTRLANVYKEMDTSAKP
jgi:RNA polymerase sigma-70 factor (ECF subfamily)